MLKRIFTFIVLTIFFFAGCSSTPTRINDLNLDPTSAKGIVLNGVLISDGEKIVLDESFIKPTVPHGKETDYHFRGVSIEFTSIPAGPWQFNGTNLFPGFDSSSIRCFDRRVYTLSEEDAFSYHYCDEYIKLKGPFIHKDCELARNDNASKTYRERLTLVEQEEAKRNKKETKGEEEAKDDVDLSAGEIVAGSVGVGLMAAAVLVVAPVAVVNRGLAELGVCGSTEWVWFNHDKFFDTVKETIISDYGSVDAYITDIKLASMAYKILAELDEAKREEIEVLIREWKNSTETILPTNDSIENYPIDYAPYSLVSIPRKEDWSSRPASIESQLLSHYTEQSSSVNTQIDFYNNELAHKYGIYMNVSP